MLHRSLSSVFIRSILISSCCSKWSFCRRLPNQDFLWFLFLQLRCTHKALSQKTRSFSVITLRIIWEETKNVAHYDAGRSELATGYWLVDCGSSVDGGRVSFFATSSASALRHILWLSRVVYSEIKEPERKANPLISEGISCRVRQGLRLCCDSSSF